eukprot:scaffold129008_cov105-Phaeocystis_antarctica.AAC.5
MEFGALSKRTLCWGSAPRRGGMQRDIANRGATEPHRDDGQQPTGKVCCTPGSGRFVLNVTFLRRYSSLSGTDESGDVVPLSEATADLS